MLFTAIMSSKKKYLFYGLFLLVIIAWQFSDSVRKNNNKSELVKIALREVGHQLLLSNQDSISLVLPVVVLEKSKYKLSFQEQLSIEPNSLVNFVQKSFEKAALSKYYRVEVINCSDKDVAYSYEIKGSKEVSIIPCRSRILPKNCYTISIHFTDKTTFSFVSKLFLAALVLFTLVLLQFVFRKREQVVKPEDSDEKHNVIVDFIFYPEQNKLVKEAIEISLSKKECELLAIFVAKPNQVIRREELTKRVWEDHGVFVGRSLDTYISKLRKKLKADTTIKIINIHGIGYRLEINP